MLFNRPSRRPDARRHRPQIEAVEVRCLLSTITELPALGELNPAKTASSSSNGATPVDQIIGASQVRSTYGVSGSGLTAAVIDTGVLYKHPALGGGFGPGYVVKAGYDFGESDGDPVSTGWPHGTAVAGIIASRDARNPGVAPGADLVALRVFDDAGEGEFYWVSEALEWVIDNHKKYGISVVNLSISDGKNYLPDKLPGSFEVGRIESLIRELETLKIPVVSAAGNSFKGSQGMGFTAILEDTISVSGTDRNDRLVSDAQRLGRDSGGDSATDLVAPGMDVMAPGPNNSFVPVTGTSFAAPLVTGSVLLLQELYKSRFGVLPEVDQLADWLRKGATSIKDPATGSTFARLDLPKAAALVPVKETTKPTPAPATTPPSGKPAGGPVVFPPATPTPPVQAPASGGSRPASPPSSGATGSPTGGSSPSSNPGTSRPPSSSSGTASPSKPGTPPAASNGSKPTSNPPASSGSGSKSPSKTPESPTSSSGRPGSAPVAEPTRPVSGSNSPSTGSDHSTVDSRPSTSFPAPIDGVNSGSQEPPNQELIQLEPESSIEPMDSAVVSVTEAVEPVPLVGPLDSPDLDDATVVTVAIPINGPSVPMEPTEIDYGTDEPPVASSNSSSGGSRNARLAQRTARLEALRHQRFVNRLRLTEERQLRHRDRWQGDPTTLFGPRAWFVPDYQKSSIPADPSV